MARPTARDVHVDRPLSNIAIAYRNDTYIADQVFPQVPVENQSDVYFIFDKGAWFRLPDKSMRAPGTRAPRIDYTLTTGCYFCVEYALANGIPDEVRDNADDPLQPDENATTFVTSNLLNLYEDRVATLVTACANWANSASPTTQWDSATSDPVNDIDTARNTVLKEIGRLPNTLVMGWEVWTALKDHPDLLDRIKHTQRGILTSDLAAEVFEVDRLLVGKAVKDSATLEGETASMGFVWGKQAILMYVSPAPALMEPAAGYTLVWRPFETSRFHEDQERQDVVEVRHNIDEVITGSDAGYCIAAAIS